MWGHRSWSAVALVAAVAAGGLLAGCDDAPAKPAPGASTVPTIAPATAPVATAAPSKPAPATTGAPAPAGASVTCAEVRGAKVRGSKAPYTAAGVPLVDGHWSGPDGLTFAVQAPCATGNLDPHGGLSTLGTIMSSTSGTTGRFWGLMLCKREAGAPVCSVLVQLGDREPVQSVAIGGQKATVVYLTRTPDVPAAGLNLRRTAVYQFGGNTLLELSHTDEAYTP
ncbi:hypothetical protein AB0M43_32770 [Longispora sp. NPDC051575]|uniref:hypothetical protein n=1 Tax=Longispora sp. NPDC051575 TaxID=3154943 RepID=UPI00342D8F14